jgi:hypothetical protein
MERRRLLGAAITALVAVRAGFALAATDDYCFEVVAVRTGMPGKTAVEVAILRARSYTPITDAMVVRSSASPGLSHDLRTVTQVVPFASGRLGTHRFEVDTTVAGIWTLKVTFAVPRASRSNGTNLLMSGDTYARILPGNAELVSGSVTFVAGDASLLPDRADTSSSEDPVGSLEAERSKCRPAAVSDP